VAADGNWIHIHYQSKLQAKKVLSKNGKVFGGSIMVGVAPCIDKVGTSHSQSIVRNFKCIVTVLSPCKEFVSCLAVNSMPFTSSLFK